MINEVPAATKGAVISGNFHNRLIATGTYANELNPAKKNRIQSAIRLSVNSVAP